MRNARVPLAETVLLGPPEPIVLNRDRDPMVRFFLTSLRDRRDAHAHGFRLQTDPSGANPEPPKDAAGPVPVCRIVAFQELAWHPASRTPRVPDVEALIGLVLHPAARDLAGCKPRKAVEVLYRLCRHWPAGHKFLIDAVLDAGVGATVSLAVDPARLRPDASPEAIVRAVIRQVLAGCPPEQAIARAYEHNPPPAPCRPRHRWAGAGRPHVVYHAVLGPARIPPDLAWLLVPPGTPGAESAEAAARPRRSIDGFRVGLCYTPPSDWAMVPMTVEEGDQAARWLFAGILEALRCDGVPALELRCSLPWPDGAGDRGAMALATVLRAWPDGQKILAFGPAIRSQAVIVKPGPFGFVGLRLGSMPFRSVEAIFRAAFRAALGGAGAPRLRPWLARLTAADARALEVLATLG